MSLSSEAHGSSYSTSPTSSIENVSTVETGELSVFTFIIPQKSGAASPASPCNSHHSKCSITDSTPYNLLHPAHCSCDIEPFLRESNTSDTSFGFTMDPLRLDDPHTFHCKYHHHHTLRKFIEQQQQQQSTRCSCHSYTHHQPFHQISHVFSDNNYIRHLPRYGDGILLRSLERGVLFPVIHWLTKCSENLLHPTSQFSPTLNSNQGIYKEIKRVIPADIWLQREVDPNLTLSRSISSLNGSTSSLSSSSRKPTWIIIGYKSLEKTLDSSLEATWKEWTGIRHVYLHLRSDFEIRKISFLHRVHPIDNLDLFMYIVLMEIGNVEDSNKIWLLDFVQRMRVERMKGFLTVYSQVEQEISSIDEQYKKYLGEVVPSPPLVTPPPIPPKLRNQSQNSISPISLENGTSTTTTLSTPPASISNALLDYHTSEINGNIKFMEKLLEEIHQQPITGDYF